MSTITLEISDDLAAAINANPDLQARAAALITRHFPMDDEEDEEYPLTPEDIASLKRGAADSDAGRYSDGRTHVAEMREYLRQRQEARGAEAA